MDRRLPGWRNTNAPPKTKQSLLGAVSGRLCVETGGKDIGTRKLYRVGTVYMSQWTA